MNTMTGLSGFADLNSAVGEGASPRKPDEGGMSSSGSLRGVTLGVGELDESGDEEGGG